MHEIENVGLRYEFDLLGHLNPKRGGTRTWNPGLGSVGKRGDRSVVLFQGLSAVGMTSDPPTEEVGDLTLPGPLVGIPLAGDLA